MLEPSCAHRENAVTHGDVQFHDTQNKLLPLEVHLLRAFEQARAMVARPEEGAPSMISFESELQSLRISNQRLQDEKDALETMLKKLMELHHKESRRDDFKNSAHELDTAIGSLASRVIGYGKSVVGSLSSQVVEQGTEIPNLGVPVRGAEEEHDDGDVAATASTPSLKQTNWTAGFEQEKKSPLVSPAETEFENPVEVVSSPISSSFASLFRPGSFGFKGQAKAKYSREEEDMGEEDDGDDGDDDEEEEADEDEEEGGKK